MSPHTVTSIAKRLAEYAAEEKPTALAVVLHGGEPLLAGVPRLSAVLDGILAEMPDHTRLDFSIQTNGVLLDESFLDMFARYGVRVGISLDGDRTANDRHRLGHDGRSSFEAVERGIALLRRPAYAHLYAGLLATVDVRNDPVGTYESLLRYEPPAIDLLLPHGNWTTPPPFIERSGSTMSYADWLIAVFDRWYSAPRAETGIRLFESILSLLLGGPSRTRAIGAAATSLLSIETDGGIEGDDALKTTVVSVVDTGLSVHTHSLAEAAAHPSIAGPDRPVEPAAVCRECPVFDACGGGHPAHRYRAGSGFDNPSVYCAELFDLINHMRSRVQADLDLRR